MKMTTDWDILNTPLQTIKYRDFRLIGMSWETEKKVQDVYAYQWQTVNSSEYWQLYWPIEVERDDRSRQYCFRLSAR